MTRTLVLTYLLLAALFAVCEAWISADAAEWVRTGVVP